MSRDTKKFKSKLLDEKENLEKELATVGRRNPDNPSDWEPMPENQDALRSDASEVADKLESFEENVAIVRQFEARLAEVKDALEHIAEDTYGHCASCGAAIEEDRLEANPAARTCKSHLK